MRITLLIAIAACSSQQSPDPDAEALPRGLPAATKVAPPVALDVNPRVLRRFKAIHPRSTTDATPADLAKIDLGRMLFFDKRMSRDRDLACNSCHRLDKYGVDHTPTSLGTKGQLGRRNSPSVYHAGTNFTSFWDGRAADVEEQAKMPLVNPSEMGMADPHAVVAMLAQVPGYVAAFKAAFPSDATAVTFDHVGVAIGAFERGLVTPSRWDKYLEGDTTALTRDEVAGFKLFTDVGCISCHTGELVGGSMFQKAGFVKPWPNQNDLGRYEVTKLEADKMMFKVPGLRNVAMTAPYFHDGSAATLEGAVKTMGTYQIDATLTDAEVKLISTWLGSLTGELPTTYIAEPKLP